MSHKCSICCIEDCYKRYYSKLIGSIDEDASYFCDKCYEEKKDIEETFIKNNIKNDMNIANIVKYQYLMDYINPTSNNCIIKPMPIFRIVNENNKDYVMINIEDYNNYIRRVAISNKKLVDETKIDKRQEKQQMHDAVEKRKIEAIKAKERREIEMREMIERKIEKQPR